jgi:hypothetical protein
MLFCVCVKSLYFLFRTTLAKKRASYHQNHFPGCCPPRCYRSSLTFHQSPWPLCCGSGHCSLLGRCLLFGLPAPVTISTIFMHAFFFTIELTLCTEGVFAAIVEAIPAHRSLAKFNMYSKRRVCNFLPKQANGISTCYLQQPPADVFEL